MKAEVIKSCSVDGVKVKPGDTVETDAATIHNLTAKGWLRPAKAVDNKTEERKPEPPEPVQVETQEPSYITREPKHNKRRNRQ